jgi:hypothetical protein
LGIRIHGLLAQRKTFLRCIGIFVSDLDRGSRHPNVTPQALTFQVRDQFAEFFRRRQGRNFSLDLHITPLR